MVSVFKGNISFAANTKALNSSLTDEIDFNALVKGGRIVENSSPWEPTSGKTSIAWMVLGIILSILAGLTGALYLCRRRLFAAAIGAPQEDERFQVTLSSLPKGIREWQKKNLYRKRRNW